MVIKRVKVFTIFLLILFSGNRIYSQINSAVFSKDQLVEDTRQLVKILEASHPDPYINFGGKINFHREFQSILISIFDEGMTAEEYYNLLLPFIAKIGDMHTGLINQFISTISGPGLPLVFKIIEQDLVVTGVFSSDFKNLLGARLISIGGISIEELRARQTRLKGIENSFGELVFLLINLKTAAGIKNLIPEWNTSEFIEAEFISTNGNKVSVEMKLDTEKVLDPYTFPSKLVVPLTNKSDVVYDFTDEKKETVLLVISNMERYREASESWFADGMQQAVEFTKTAYKYFNDSEPPAEKNELLKGIPSVTGIFADMISDMKKYDVKNLIVDLRDNTGGNSIMKEMLIYFLFGRDGIMESTPGYQIKKYSDLYFQQYSSDSLSILNKDKNIKYSAYDYDFSQEIAFRKKQNDFVGLEDMLKNSPTFWAVYSTKKYDRPLVPIKNIFVLCSPFTTSSGFNLLTDLYKKGAKIVGTASAQPGNNFGDILFFELNHSGLKGYVSFKQNVTFPDDPEKGKCLMPDYVLTYEKFSSLNFDPESEILYTLELIEKNK